ncbi:hypothetical protein ISN44_As05g036590 [Arabidopsis suecica]|uniref:Uncharacterized protein n=1 Tax=Arabidopsis suecica TaxID=45249 RepID=A0A8T2DHJ1_ARASU|nr:hypothetical protein ISN44_As05g036590 [Arabidopsis suecica]
MVLQPVALVCSCATASDNVSINSNYLIANAELPHRKPHRPS